MAGIQYPTFTGVNTVLNVATGSTRWNTTTNSYEMYDGQNWTPVTQGWTQKESLAESVLHAQDQIGYYIEEDYKDNVTIQDAFAEWQEATERFRVILALAEKNK